MKDPFRYQNEIILKKYITVIILKTILKKFQQFISQFKIFIFLYNNSQNRMRKFLPIKIRNRFKNFIFDRKIKFK